MRALGCTLVVSMASGCGGNEDADDLEAAEDATRSAQMEAAGPVDSDTFDWPVDPSHPVLELRIEMAEASGRILIELMPELAPASVVNIIGLADEGYYDGTTFHRVIPGFMLQGGDPRSRDRDPTNDGTGASGRPLKDEFSRAPFLRGVVGLGNKGRANSTSTQFFIMHADNQNLDGRYNAIGRVLAGMELVDAITRVEIDRNGRWGPKDRPIRSVVMTSARTVGQVIAIRQAIALESEQRQLATATRPAPLTAFGAPDTPVAGSASPPAAHADDEDWERLEAESR